nr:MAG TPA: hypothetical protein [Caudoviricetes sp.]
MPKKHLIINSVTIFTQIFLSWNRLCGYISPHSLFYFLMKIL